MGAVTDESALEEIENVARVFAYEQRMKDYTPLFHTTYQAQKLSILHEKKPEVNNRFVENSSPRILVKGLC